MVATNKFVFLLSGRKRAPGNMILFCDLAPTSTLFAPSHILYSHHLGDFFFLLRKEQNRAPPLLTTYLVLRLPDTMPAP